MITNIWNKINFYCDNHKEPIPFIVQQGVQSQAGSFSSFYACKKYNKQEREENEKPCLNRLNFFDAEAIVKEISKKLADAEFNGIEINLTNMNFKTKNIDVRILKHTSDKIDVAILNRKVFK